MQLQETRCFVLDLGHGPDSLLDLVVQGIVLDDGIEGALDDRVLGLDLLVWATVRQGRAPEWLIETALWGVASGMTLLLARGTYRDLGCGNLDHEGWEGSVVTGLVWKGCLADHFSDRGRARGRAAVDSGCALLGEGSNMVGQATGGTRFDGGLLGHMRVIG
ncbi:uncharacterized protein BJ171DRAFT_507304 [Polychytrium aggregatum]|uniref:uncharacterized protein n=1 Tax=Polychytrium aggregatum TaxID=110093 RepID=UPI0022FE648F|nr:uncharacterized protein BJ171DRAFT_507304 [Polychytrium aggregatum]KAI9203995.1 hypothetical protein BJ171DRAFT_507304 [Polychytrium aggregatum]